MDKKNIILGLEKEILKYLDGDDVLVFEDEERLFHYFYKRYGFAFEDIYKKNYNVSKVPTYDWLFNGLKRDTDFFEMWNRIKMIANIENE